MKSSYRRWADQGLSLVFHYPSSQYKQHWKCCIHSPHKLHGLCSCSRLQSHGQELGTAQLHAASKNPQGQAENKPPPSPLAAKPTPGAAQGVGTGLKQSYQFVWCNQQHCHVHTDTNVQISAEFDGWADGRQVIKSIWSENHCHFQLKIAPANSHHNFVLFRVELQYQSKWWYSFLGRSCKIFSNSTLTVAVWQGFFPCFLMHQVL